jgi:hypothetical protein
VHSYHIALKQEEIAGLGIKLIRYCINKKETKTTHHTKPSHITKTLSVSKVTLAELLNLLK